MASPSDNDPLYQLLIRELKIFNARLGSIEEKLEGLPNFGTLSKQLRALSQHNTPERCNQLRVEKEALLRYISELEGFLGIKK